MCVALHLAANVHLNLGLATLVAFDCYLRVGELVVLSIHFCAEPDVFETHKAHTQETHRGE